jgi:pimeloyl-ACP methyl ester carboxylesterase
VIRYDHRDTGRSTSYGAGGAAYTVEDLADDAVGILDAYGIGSAHFVGMSLGGILAQLAALNAGAEPMGAFGAVVGATIGDATTALSGSGLAINGPLLVPGFGTQGGTVSDINRIFGSVLPNVIPSTSRGVLSQGPDVQALRDSVARVNAELVGS